jgi:hypothetical protein
MGNADECDHLITQLENFLITGRDLLPDERIELSLLLAETKPEEAN